MDKIKVVIEIPKGSRNKIEYKDGKFVTDRVLPEGCEYPAAYGFVPGTLMPDGDALDVFFVTRDALITGEEREGYPVGVIRVIDNGEEDDKLVVIANPHSRIDYPSLTSFLEKYKSGVVVQDLWLDEDTVRSHIIEQIENYQFNQSVNKVLSDPQIQETLEALREAGD